MRQEPGSLKFLKSRGCGIEIFLCIIRVYNVSFIGYGPSASFAQWTNADFENCIYGSTASGKFSYRILSVQRLQCLKRRCMSQQAIFFR
jgi:hypothetical protein